VKFVKIINYKQKIIKIKIKVLHQKRKKRRKIKVQKQRKNSLEVINNWMYL